MFRLGGAEQAVARFRTRVLYGDKEELLELVALRSIGRVRARSLFAAGYTGIEALKRATIPELANVPAIGGKTAAEIKSQVVGNSDGATWG